MPGRGAGQIDYGGHRQRGGRKADLIRRVDQQGRSQGQVRPGRQDAKQDRRTRPFGDRDGTGTGEDEMRHLEFAKGGLCEDQAVMPQNQDIRFRLGPAIRPVRQLIGILMGE
jgi:hypothetical protein